MDLVTEFIPHARLGESDATMAEPGPSVLRAYLLREAVFQELMQLKAKASLTFVRMLSRKFGVHSSCA